ncbi:MAG: hypothetical protein ACP5I4_12430 [Oceanipulchritudo sp.]
MKVCRVDSKKRVVLPGGKPGDYMLVEETEAGTYTLKRMEMPRARPKSAAAVRKVLTERPLKMRMDWDALRKLTREP